MIALITGGTAGIGRHIAEKLAEAGASVLVTGRDPERGLSAARELGGEFVAVDHSTGAGNLAFAEALAERGVKLDILVNNVGAIAQPTQSFTSEGYDLLLAVNYLAPVTLTNALLPLLAPDVRIVNVVSSAFTMHTGDPFTEPATYTAIGAYARAKQLTLLATMSLARRLQQTPARVNAVNPGMAWTPSVQALTPAAVPAWRFIWPIVRLVQRSSSAEKAARLPASLALEPPGSGEYYESKGKPTELPSRLQDPGLQDRAWREGVIASREAGNDA
jgi:NAD(P)-dependent dehydrogenase (short-subunit alcohol dehydrogenase family)